MQLFIAFFFATTLVWLIVNWQFFHHKNIRNKTLCIIFILKLLFGVAFFLVYTSYYTDNQTSDMHKFFKDAEKIFELTKKEPRSYFSILTGIDVNDKDKAITNQLSFWYQEESASVINDSRMVIRFNLLLLPFSRGNIYLHLVLIVFLSFIGLYLIFLSFVKYFQYNEILLTIACFGAPSVMFWSSGIMKEGLLIFFLGIVIYVLFNETKNWLVRSIFFLLAISGMFFSKFYVALALIPSLLFLLIAYYFKHKAPKWQLLITCILVIITAIGFNTILNNEPLQKLSKKQNDFINLSIGGIYLSNTVAPYDTIYTNKSNSLISSSILIEGKMAQLKTGTIYHHWKNPGYADTLVAQNKTNFYKILKVLEPTGSAITLKRLMPNYKSVILLFPEAFVNVCFRPFIFDVENVFSLMAFLENVIFIIFILLLIFLFKSPSVAHQRIIIFSLLFVFTLYTLVGLTTPVLGAAVRYKVPALPFLLISIFLFYDNLKLKGVLNSLRNQ
jgi:hypothetical protein